ncbi:MAG: hypothetical protein Q8O61_06845 [Nocardioides sp.]|nr:hypothetical protein [Nocardioides sp.]
MRRFATVLGVVATLVTLACGGVVVAAGAPEQAPPAAPVPPWQRVTTAVGSFEVPPGSTGWTVREPDQVVYYADASGDPVVGVAGPAVLDDGYCRQATGASNRGFAGLTGPHPGPLRQVNVREARRWRTAVAGRPTTDGRTTRLVLADGAAAVHTSALVRPAPAGPCQPERVALDHVSVTGPTGVVTLVVVRDLGPDAASASEVDRLLRSLRVF